MFFFWNYFGHAIFNTYSHMHHRRLILPITQDWIRAKWLVKKMLWLQWGTENRATFINWMTASYQILLIFIIFTDDLEMKIPIWQSTLWLWYHDIIMPVFKVSMSSWNYHKMNCFCSSHRKKNDIRLENGSGSRQNYWVNKIHW